MLICELFSVAVARSKGTDDYSEGDIPFVTNSAINNGIVKYVEPFEGDKIFEGPAICISGLGYATVHFGSFLPKGNGGDSCTVFKPLEPLTKAELLYYAALFNTLHGWRFSFGRKASRRRLENLDLSPLHTNAPLDLGAEVDKNNEMMNRLMVAKEQQLKD